MAEKKSVKNAFSGEVRSIRISKVSQRKISEYIRDVYINGKPRIVAYAENIDPTIYSLESESARNKLDSVSRDRDDFKELKDMVLKEDREHMLRRSGLLQRKSMELLISTIDAAQRALDDGGGDPRAISSATGVLKTLMPALEAVNRKDENYDSVSPEKRKNRARLVIN